MAQIKVHRTKREIPAVSPYRFRITADSKWITISRPDGKEESYQVATLQWIASNDEKPEPVRDMARQALAAFGLLPRVEEDIVSETIVTIQGVKVYQLLISRAFFIFWKGSRLFGSLSDIERKIKKAKGSR